jgi:hypothetical protein
MNAPVRITTETPEERAERLEYEAWEALRAEIEDEHRHWQRFDESREDVPVGDWLAIMAQPHMRDCERYREAMDASERRLSDAHLSHIVKGHKAFEQSEGWTR